MPWSVAPLRPGRPWVTAPDARTLRTRWDRLVQADSTTREHLFHPTRTRTLHTRVPALPSTPAGTTPLALESGPCPTPLRFTHGPFDQQWLIPDHRLLDAARPELWRVADERQLFLVEQGYLPKTTGPALTVSALLPDGRSPGRPGRIRPLYRRPGATEPNVTPGLLPFLGKAYGHDVTPEDLLAWTVAAAQPSPSGCVLPLTPDPLLWERGVELGHRIVELTVRGARGGDKPRLPGGRRPYVRAAVPARPDALRYDPEDESLYLGEGRISPVPPGAWEFEVNGVRVLELWFEERTGTGEPGTLEALRPASWPQEWTSDLLELITVLALLDELRPRRRELADGPRLARDRLVEARVLPVPPAARRPASVLDHHEEGPDGQLALL
ncbi:type ISP restriction/modification enzyme [Streptomyces sp. BPTC-684]|uniref:type ISP restriction/modification enzyme n=1 Tax=Streptomyces sp. BPTC-684 TaxID=3043734 RepID=UPI0024B268FA|nr:type ISP restriction/modification enzyme [Streptomyces sp. BPTC-684]WHM41442.1 DNA methyltransferase [Streptomyces sp. BPTC-684]